MVLSTWQSAGEEVSIKLARTLYVAAVEEWAVKKGTGLHSSMFDDLIVKCPNVARVVLPQPLISAGTSARSPYIKSESFRILTSLYHVSVGKTKGDNNKVIITPELQKSAPSLVNAVITALQDEGLKKVKHTRSVLDAGKEVTAFANKWVQVKVETDLQSGPGLLWEALGNLEKHLEALDKTDVSQAVKMVSMALVRNISEGHEAWKSLESIKTKKVITKGATGSSPKSANKKKKNKKNKRKSS